MTADVTSSKRSWLRRAALSLVLVLLLLAGVLVYLHTSHGFRHVIVPLVASLTKAEISVRDGFLSLGGTLAIDGLQFRAPNKGISVESERFYLSVSLLPIFRGQLPVVRDLQLNTTMVTLTEPTETGEQPSKPSGAERESTSTLVPVIIERARVQQFSLTRLTTGGTMTVRDASVTVDHLQPEQTGSIKLAMNFSHERGSSAVPVSGTFALDLALEQNPSGTVFRWDGTDTIAVESGLPDPEADHSQAITFAQTLSGQYESTTQNLHLVSSIAAKRGEDSLGQTRAEVRLDGEKEQQPLQVTMKVEGLTGEALTLLLMGVSPVQFASGRLDGDIQADRVDKLMGVRTTLAGRQLRLRHGEQTTPPVDIKVDQVGSFDEETQDLSVETLNVTVSDDARRLVTATLERPMVMKLISRPRDTADAHARKSDHPAEGAVKVALHGLTVRDLRPWLALTGQDSFTSLMDGELNGTADLTVFNEGRALDLIGRLSFTKVMVQTEPGAGILGPLEIQSETHATLTDFAMLKVEQSTASVALRTKQVFRAAMSGSIQVAKPTAIQILEGTLTLDGLPLETMNPILATRGSARVHRAMLDGGGKVHVGGGRITWDVTIQGKEISLKLPDMAGPTPPLEAHLKQIGSFDRTTETLRLEDLAIQVLENRRPVLVGTLNKPLVLPLSRRDARSGGAAETAPIALTLEVSQLGVHQIRPWTALSGRSFLAQARNGEMTGRFQINVQGTADHIDLDGNLDLNDLQIERPGSHVMAAPVTVRSRLHAKIRDLARITLDSSSIQVSTGPRLLAQFSGTGTVDGKSETADLKVQAASVNLTDTLDRLGILTPKQRRLVDGGDFKSESTVAASGPGQPFKVATTLRLDKLTVRLDAHHTQTHSLMGQGSVMMNSDRSEMHFEQVGMTLLSDGKEAGSFTMAGHWPLAAGEAHATPKPARKQSGELEITVKGWDANVPVSFFDVLPGREPGPLPVNLAITVKQDPAQPTVMLHGSGAIGPLHPRRTGRAAESKTLQLEQELTRHGDEVRITALSLTTQRAQGHADHVTLSGIIRVGERPRVQAHGTVEMLDAKWFADLLTDPAKPEQAEATVTAVGAAPLAPAHTGKGFPADLDVEVEIGSVNYEGLKAERGRLTARGTGGNLHTALSPTKLAGGTIEGTADVTMVQSEPHIKWSVRGQNLPVESLLLAFTHQSEPQVIGMASFNTTGTGRGSGETLKRTLTGTASFDVKNGRFVKSELLAYIARQTLIDEFEHMGFDTLHGELHTKEGWVHLHRMHAVSPAIVLDAGGRVGLDGTLDVKVWPRVSAHLAKKVGGACFAPLLHTVDGFTVFPFAVSVTGTLKQRQFGMEIRAEDIVTKNMSLLAGGILKTLEGCGSLPMKGGEQAMDTLKDAAKGIFEGLLGGRSKDRQRQ